jgi:predicted exporter
VNRPLREYRAKLLFTLLWGVLFISCSLFCAYKFFTGNPIYSNLLELFPQDEQKPVLHDLSALLANRFQDNLWVLVKNDASVETSSQVADLQRRIKQSPLLVESVPSDLYAELVKFYKPYSRQLLTNKKRQWLSSHTPAQLAEDSYRKLFSPVTTPQLYPFADDPFNLGADWLQHLRPKLTIRERAGITFVRAEREGDIEEWYLVAAKLQTNPFDLPVQRDVTTIIEGFKAEYPQAEILTSGMIFHAAAGTAQARSEISSVGLGSIVAIVLLVLFVFRSSIPLAAVLVTLFCGCLLALSVSLLVFGRIHILTIAFGSTLLGVAVDYVFHFLISSRFFCSSFHAPQHIK